MKRKPITVWDFSQQIENTFNSGVHDLSLTHHSASAV